MMVSPFCPPKYFVNSIIIYILNVPLSLYSKLFLKGLNREIHVIFESDTKILGFIPLSQVLYKASFWTDHFALRNILLIAS